MKTSDAQGILILGGSGFIGKALTARLQSTYPEIYSISRRNHDCQSFTNVQHYQCSLDNLEVLAKLLPRCRTLFHLASETTPGSSTLHPAIEATNNLLPSLRLLECLQNFPHVNLVYVSTGGAIYGNIDAEKVSEKMPLSPLSYYGAGKAALEKFICAYCRQTGNNAVILRPSNVYGPGQKFREGFGIIPTTLKNLLDGKVVPVWGRGDAVRDYLYIDDFIDFCCKMLNEEGAYRDRDADVYNIGSGKGYSIEELMQMIEKITGLEIARTPMAARTIDVQRVVLNSAKAEKKFAWLAQTDLETGIEKTWQWFCTHQR